MPWFVRGSYVLDRVFGTSLAADVDVFFIGTEPTAEQVSGVLGCPVNSVDINKAGFEAKLNIDQLVIDDSDILLRDGEAISPDELPVPLEIVKINMGAHLNMDDCIRILKTRFKYPKYLVLGVELENDIIKELQESEQDELDGAIVERVLAFVTQTDLYMAVRGYLAIPCGLGSSVMDNLPDMTLPNNGN